WIPGINPGMTGWGLGQCHILTPFLSPRDLFPGSSSRVPLCRKDAPALGAEGDAGLCRGGVIDGDFDLDPLLCPAHFEFDLPGSGGAAAGGDDAGDGRFPALDDLDVMGAEEQVPLSIGDAVGIEPERAVGEIELAA